MEQAQKQQDKEGRELPNSFASSTISEIWVVPWL
jgi:hypothetical protein